MSSPRRSSHAGSARRRRSRVPGPVVDALSSSVAVLDRQGVIVQVNAAWRAFATQNGVDPAAVSEGVSYLAVCDGASGPAANGAADCARAIRAVIAGEIGEFVLEYPCHSPAVERWFNCRVTPYGLSPGRGAVVIHEDVTERHQAVEQLREERRAFPGHCRLHAGLGELDRPRWCGPLGESFC